ncbi:MAG: hypothetical protein HW380_261 [Magnetococcales bacterium]|nr:hypothetical protein [Magnetococcales bacterium]HIJ83347.1 response regulator [Magnetococcales bacterium]
MPRSILIIEDDWHFRIVLETALLGAGYEVRTAENGKAGITIATVWQPDLIIMDLEMPVMDGIPTIYILREKGFRGRILVLSGQLTPENTAKAREAGATHFFSKPFPEDPRKMVELAFADPAPPAPIDTSRPSNTEADKSAPPTQWTPPPMITARAPARPPRSGGEKPRKRSMGWLVANISGVILVTVAVVFGLSQQNHEVTPEHRSARQTTLPTPETEETSSPPANGATPSSRTATTKNRKHYFFGHQLANYYCNQYLRGNCDGASLHLNPLARDLDAIDQGREIYRHYCTRCHGSMGNADGPDAATLHSTPGRLSLSGSGILQKDAFLFWTIAEGGVPLETEMPPFKEILSEKKIWSLIRFLETL